VNGAVADALRLEWVRLHTVRSTFVLAGASVLLGVLVSALIASLGGTGRDPALTALVLTAGADVTPLPLAAVLMGVLSVGHDYRFRLVRATLLVQPRRSALVLARLVVLAATSVAVGVAGMLLSLAVGILLSHGAMALDGNALRAAVGYLVLAVLWSWLGAAGTWLLRATVPVLTILLVTPLAGEPILQVLSQLDGLAWLRPLVHWLPFAAGRALASAVSAGAGGMGQVEGGAVFGLFVLAILVAGVLAFHRRDA
jgi:ABC-2 type transport system permease protein